MKYFDLTKNYNVKCEWKETRNGFKHVATLFLDCKKVFKTSVNYLNRTWETYEFESILKKVVDLEFTNDKEHEYFRNIIL